MIRKNDVVFLEVLFNILSQINLEEMMNMDKDDDRIKIIRDAEDNKDFQTLFKTLPLQHSNQSSQDY